MTINAISKHWGANGHTHLWLHPYHILFLAKDTLTGRIQKNIIKQIKPNSPIIILLSPNQWTSKTPRSKPYSMSANSRSPHCTTHTAITATTISSNNAIQSQDPYQGSPSNYPISLSRKSELTNTTGRLTTAPTTKRQWKSRRGMKRPPRNHSPQTAKSGQTKNSKQSGFSHPPNPCSSKRTNPYS
jgi:hypothetical protein